VKLPIPTPELPDMDEADVNRDHAEVGLPPVEIDISEQAGKHPLLHVLSVAVIAGLLVLAGSFVWELFSGAGGRSGTQILIDTLHDRLFWMAVGVGLLAQIVDGALGMAYGVTASSFLLAVGAPPVMASGATHLAEVFTTGISGVTHLQMGNVNRRLCLSLIIPGVLGGLTGTYVLGNIDGNVVKPWISAYLLIMGLYVISKAFRHITLRTNINPSRIVPLALFGGFMDATGGGGWGPIVTTTLVGAGHDPRTTIGSVNFAEFFLTVGVSAAFFSILDNGVWMLVAGLVIGGLIAAPFAAYVTRHLKAKVLLVLVGTLITCISAFNLYATLAG
jgi:uncharacterized membrane protein YfcA